MKLSMWHTYDESWLLEESNEKLSTMSQDVEILLSGNWKALMAHL